MQVKKKKKRDKLLFACFASRELSMCKAAKHLQFGRTGQPQALILSALSCTVADARDYFQQSDAGRDAETASR